MRVSRKEPRGTGTPGRLKGVRGFVSGQSMLEAIVAIGIIATAVSSSLALVQGSIKGEKESERGIVSANLAREAVEVVRSIRDTNWLAGNDWDRGLEGPGFDYTATLFFDPDANVWTPDFSADSLADSGAKVFNYTSTEGNAVFGLYRQAAAQPDGTIVSPFRRLVTLDPICEKPSGVLHVVSSGKSCGTNEKVGIRLFVDIEFVVSGRVRTQRIESHLFNWRP